MRIASRGYTLLELLGTVVIVAVVLSIGVPSFADFMATQRQRAEVVHLFHALHEAKKASVTRHRFVSLCASDNGETCVARRDWSGGWILFENTDRETPPQRDPGEPVLRRRKVDSGILIESNRRAYTLRATQRRATNGTIVVCDRSGRVEPRAVVVNHFGRPRITSENRYGSGYACFD